MTANPLPKSCKAFEENADFTFVTESLRILSFHSLYIPPLSPELDHIRSLSYDKFIAASETKDFDVLHALGFRSIEAADAACEIAKTTKNFRTQFGMQNIMKNVADKKPFVLMEEEHFCLCVKISGNMYKLVHFAFSSLEFLLILGIHDKRKK